MSEPSPGAATDGDLQLSAGPVAVFLDSTGSKSQDSIWSPDWRPILSTNPSVAETMISLAGTVAVGGCSRVEERRERFVARFDLLDFLEDGDRLIQGSRKVGIDRMTRLIRALLAKARHCSPTLPRIPHRYWCAGPAYQSPRSRRSFHPSKSTHHREAERSNLSFMELVNLRFASSAWPERTAQV